MKPLHLIAAGLIATLSGCAGQNIDDYAKLEPKMDMRQFFNGEIEGWGSVFDWAGKQNTRFTVNIKAYWTGNNGTLEEDFVYDDGRKDRRVWSVAMNDNGTFSAKAHDVIGEAAGVQKGNAVNMSYLLRIPRGKSTIDLSMDDWMYLIDSKTVLNRTAMRKYGIQVGELTLVMRKK